MPRSFSPRRQQILEFLATMDMPELVLVPLLNDIRNTNPEYWQHNTKIKVLKPLADDGLIESFQVTVNLHWKLLYKRCWRITAKGRDVAGLPKSEHAGFDLSDKDYIHNFAMIDFLANFVRIYRMGQKCKVRIFFNACLKTRKGEKIEPDAVIIVEFPNGRTRCYIFENERKQSDDLDKLMKYADLDYGNLIVYRKNSPETSSRRFLLDSPLPPSTQVLFQVFDYDTDVFQRQPVQSKGLKRDSQITKSRMKADENITQRLMKKAEAIFPPEVKFFYNKYGKRKPRFMFTEGYNFYQPDEEVWLTLNGTNVRYPLISNNVT